jgi:hypothetical protein
MKIDIYAPCHENWDGMGPNPMGKHCSKCEKTVYDFSKFSDAELVHFFKSKHNVCGRFNNAQLGRVLTPTKQLSHKLTLIACGLLLTSQQTLAADNKLQLTNDSIVKSEIQKPTQMTRVFNASFNEASRPDANIVRVNIVIDSFSIDVAIDSTRRASVSIPQILSNNNINITLFDLKGDSFQLDSVKIAWGQIVFSQLTNANWTYTTPLNYQWEFPEFPIVTSMGIPSTFILGYSVPIDTYVLGNSIMNDPIKVIDTVMGAPRRLNKLPQVDKDKQQSRTKLLVWLLGLSGLFLLVWRVLKSKLKP